MFNDGLNEAVGVSVAVGPGNAVGSEAQLSISSFSESCAKHGNPRLVLGCCLGPVRLKDPHNPEHDHNDYDGDNQTENTAHSRSLQDVSDDASTQRAMHNIK